MCVCVHVCVLVRGMGVTYNISLDHYPCTILTPILSITFSLTPILSLSLSLSLSAYTVGCAENSKASTSF